MTATANAQPQAARNGDFIFDRGVANGIALAFFKAAPPEGSRRPPF
jgi:hypothetical protein